MVLAHRAIAAASAASALWRASAARASAQTSEMSRAKKIEGGNLGSATALMAAAITRIIALSYQHLSSAGGINSGHRRLALVYAPSGGMAWRRAYR